MQQLIAIALGGSVGALARFFVANGIYALVGRSFPYGTLVVNVSGCLLMGILTELMVHRFALAMEYRAAVLIGFLGAFTTFSTFAMETLLLFEDGSVLKALLNIFFSVVLCLTACWIGIIAGRTLFSDVLPPGIFRHLPGMALLFTFFATFAVSILAEILINHFNLTTEMRSVFFIGLLGSLIISSTLWISFHNPELQAEFHHLLSLFLINTLLGVSMIWSGSWIGHWIWQLKLLP